MLKPIANTAFHRFPAEKQQNPIISEDYNTINTYSGKT
jgi:hypothetical protein